MKSAEWGGCVLWKSGKWREEHMSNGLLRPPRHHLSRQVHGGTNRMGQRKCTSMPGAFYNQRRPKGQTSTTRVGLNNPAKDLANLLHCFSMVAEL